MTPSEGRIATNVRHAVVDLRASLADAAPDLGRAFWSWIGDHAPGNSLESYFLHPDRFPFLRLPYWVVDVSPEVVDDPSFLRDLTRSSVAGYGYLRLLDDVLDEPDSTATPLLPVGHFLQMELLAPYWDHFPPGSDVRAFVRRSWTASAEWTFRDAHLEDIEESDFLAVCSRKMSASRMPVFAACRRAGASDDMLDRWLAFVDALAAFEQFVDDFFDWHIDLSRGRTSYLLSEAARRAGSSAQAIQWLLSDGMTWARDQLAHLRARADRTAARLGSSAAHDHLTDRWQFVEQSLSELHPGSNDLANLREVVERGDARRS